ncbi:MAG: dihydropteroate synthase [Chitinophagales bacterium]|nr:dihydropteroate synthase [Chitinophagales bacterium]MDW8392955.1 dihydropteroate synthase [Chitinophagales bacterium]
MNGAQTTPFYFNAFLRCRDRLLDLSRPQVMGIINMTDDSFYAGSRSASVSEALRRAEHMLSQGAAVLDIGGMSSRPGSLPVSEAEELKRLIPAVEAICQSFPEALVSVDTWRARVVHEACEAGASVVNDISAGALDPDLWPMVAKLNMPYVLMHMKGTPATMQQQPHYDHVVREVFLFFRDKLMELHASGIHDIILDPGFGFGKTLQHNYQLLSHLKTFAALGYPVMAGLSRKSMVYRPLGLTPEEALNGTTALHMIALQQGARLLRAHDVAEAVQTIRLWELLTTQGQDGI